MKDNNKVSIIIPIYNCEKYLDKCIKSIINQTYKNIEIILVNDGSTDSSYKICKKYEASHKNIILINKDNFGAPSARNLGLEISKGDYIIFFDSDDVMHDNAVEKLLQTIKKEKADLVIGSANDINENDVIIKNKPHLPKINLCNTNKQYFTCDPYPGNKLYKKSIIEKEHIRFGNVRIGQDLNFFIKYLLFVNKVVFINDIVSDYRIVNTGISKTYDYRIFDIVESFKDIDKFYKLNNKYKEYEKILNSLKIIHFERQMAKNKFYKNKNERIVIIKFFKNFIKLYIKGSLLSTKDLFTINLKLTFSKIYSSKLYGYYRKKLKIK